MKIHIQTSRHEKLQDSESLKKKTAVFPNYVYCGRMENKVHFVFRFLISFKNSWK